MHKMLPIKLLILSLAFVSGFIIMGVELLGGRILSPYFGSSIYVWGSIITVFMMSLSIGYLVGGKLSLLHSNLNRYGLFYRCCDHPRTHDTVRGRHFGYRLYLC